MSTEVVAVLIVPLYPYCDPYRRRLCQRLIHFFAHRSFKRTIITKTDVNCMVPALPNPKCINVTDLQVRMEDDEKTSEIRTKQTLL